MADLLLGAIAAAIFFLLLQFTQQRQLTVAWWQWALIVLNLLYAVFVCKVVLSFLEEGMPKGAIVMGSTTSCAKPAVALARFWGVALR